MYGFVTDMTFYFNRSKYLNTFDQDRVVRSMYKGRVGEGISRNSTENDVITTYGPPDKSYGPLEMWDQSSDEYKTIPGSRERLLIYNQGISFQFVDDLLIKVTVNKASTDK